MNEATKPGLTPEQHQLFLRLESIFMPQAKRQRLQARFGDGATGQPTRFVHYTSAEAALAIIRTKRFWMRNATCMSDYREVQHGFAMLNGFFSDKGKYDSFVAVLDACYPGVAQEAVNLFNKWWRDIQFSTYIASLSEHDDKEDFNGRLSMWRAFGGNTARVAVVFRIPPISMGALALNVIFSPVAYLTESEAHDVIREVIQNIDSDRVFLRTVDRQMVMASVFGMFLVAVVCLKHEGFREEREWRAIYCPTFNFSALMESTTEVVGGVPQVVYKVPMDATAAPILADLDFVQLFDRLIIGPSPYPMAMAQAFISALSKAGVSGPDKRVFASLIPIRA
jgi:hypothetical protein